MTNSKKKEKMVSAVFKCRADAQGAYDALILRGYGPNQVNMLMSDATREFYMGENPEGETQRQAGTHAAEGVAAGGAVGTALGATLAAVAAIGTNLIIPGLSLVIAGPIAAALAGGGAGAVTGGIIGGLIGYGIPDPDARAYQEALRDGGVVLGVIPRHPGDIAPIQDIFREARGESICYS